MEPGHNIKALMNQYYLIKRGEGTLSVIISNGYQHPLNRLTIFSWLRRKKIGLKNVDTACFSRVWEDSASSGTLIGIISTYPGTFNAVSVRDDELWPKTSWGNLFTVYRITVYFSPQDSYHIFSLAHMTVVSYNSPKQNIDTLFFGDVLKNMTKQQSK